MLNAGSEVNQPGMVIPPGIIKRFLFLLVWSPIGTVTYFLVSGLVQGLPSPLASGEEWVWLKLSLLAFLLSGITPGVVALLGGRLYGGVVWGLTAAVFGGVGYLANWLDHPLPATGLVILAAGAALLNLCLPAAARGRWKVLIPPAGLAAVIYLLSLPMALEYTPAKLLYFGYSLPQEKILASTVYPVNFQLFRAPLLTPDTQGGGFSRVKDTVVLVTGDGEFYRLKFSPEGNRLTTEPLSYRVPTNRAAFRKSEFYPLFSQKFRVHDLLLLESEDTDHIQVFVTHHFFHEAENCVSMRLSTFRAFPEEFFSGLAYPEWQTLYETQACIPLKVNGKGSFAGHQGGGRILQKSRTKILVSVGDHALDGHYLPHVASQDLDSDYGKILEIDRVSGSRRIFSLGLRNPQGLYGDMHGNIWVTDHGPKGGDELNLVEEGGNYGWPLETWGANYDHFTWTPQGTKPAGVEFTSPVFGWLPSIGISSLAGVDYGVFERWQGDLVVGSLRAKSIYRVHLDGAHPVFSEQIYLGQRIRDLALDARGRIVLWMDNGRIGLLTPLPDPGRIH